MACSSDDSSRSFELVVEPSPSAGSYAGAGAPNAGQSGSTSNAANAGSSSAGSAGSTGAIAGTAGIAGSSLGGVGGSGAIGGVGAMTGGGTAGSSGASGTSGTSGTGGMGGSTSPCPADMVLVVDSCVDRYEAPNQLGALPLTMQTAYDGEDWCASKGKRLCTDIEWIRACEGPQGYQYPYGNSYIEHACNDDKTWIAPDWTALGTYPAQPGVDEAERLYQADPSGSRDQCVSDEGVYDLTGNVAEWVIRTIPNSNNYDHVLKGCYWSKCYGGSNPNCSFVNPAHPGTFRTYEGGFRCCRDIGPLLGVAYLLSRLPIGPTDFPQ